MPEITIRVDKWSQPQFIKSGQTFIGLVGAFDRVRRINAETDDTIQFHVYALLKRHEDGGRGREVPKGGSGNFSEVICESGDK